jgi:hypothetical protein
MTAIDKTRLDTVILASNQNIHSTSLSIYRVYTVILFPTIVIVISSSIIVICAFYSMFFL